MVGDVESAPFLAGLPDGFSGRIAKGWFEPEEIDGGDVGIGIGWVTASGAVLRGLDVFGWDPG